MNNLLILSVLAVLPLPLTYIISYPLSIVYILPLIFQIYKLRKGNPVFLSEKTIEILSFFCLLFFIFDSIFISRRLIVVAIHLTMGLILIKSFNLKTKRDEYLYLVLVFFLISAGIANSFHITLFPYLLICLFYFLRYLMEDNEMGRERINYFSSITLFGAAIIALPFFIIFPRIKAPYMPGIGFTGETQILSENELDLNDIENLKKKNEIVLRVKFDRKIERGKEIYIRYKTFSHYLRGVWTQTKPEYKFIRAEDFGYFELSKKNREYKVEVFSKILMQNLPLPYGTVSLEIPLEFINLARDGTFLLPSSWQRRKIKFSAGLNDEVFLPRAQEPSKEEKKETDSLKIKELSKKIFEEEKEDLKKIEKLINFFYKNYNYGIEDTDLEEFLFVKKTGHCELFASACVLILREGGIPARIVTGWLGGEAHPWQNYLIIRSSNSHAWVEAWVGGRWILVDPTPPSFRPQILEGNIKEFFKYFYESLSFFWDRNVLGFTYLEQIQVLNFLKDNINYLWKIIYILISLFFFVFIAITLRKIKLKSRPFYLKYYKKIRDKAIKKFKLPETIPPEKLSLILKEFMPEKEKYIENFLKLYLASSFGRRHVNKKEFKFSYKKIKF